MACDMCGRAVATVEPLRDHYQTNWVKLVCPDCRKRCDDQLWQLRGEIEGHLKRWINEQVRRPTDKPQGFIGRLMFLVKGHDR